MEIFTSTKTRVPTDRNVIKVANESCTIHSSLSSAYLPGLAGHFPLRYKLSCFNCRLPIPFYLGPPVRKKINRRMKK